MDIIADFVNLLSEHNIVVEKMEVLNEIIYEKDVDVQPADKTFYLDRGEEIEISVQPLQLSIQNGD
ncbi:hypothetical protein LPJ68_004070 [Coemansia sp. RSA 1086]|nr:hypothetical protein LPJ68_004070 [Coemansia sp. RSA 1086]